VTRFDSTERIFTRGASTSGRGSLPNIEQFLKIDEKHFAEQITLAEHKLLWFSFPFFTSRYLFFPVLISSSFFFFQSKIRPLEIVSRVFGEKQNWKRDTPNISNFVDHFSHVSSFFFFLSEWPLPLRLNHTSKFASDEPTLHHIGGQRKKTQLPSSGLAKADQHCIGNFSQVLKFLGRYGVNFASGFSYQKPFPLAWI